MNHIVLMGRLTRDPEMRNTQTGVEVCSFTLAVDRRFKKGDAGQTADFFDCSAWRERAAFVSTYLHKGSKVVVEGSMQSRKYEASDGSKRTAWDVQVSNVEFCESKGAHEAVSDAAEPDAPQIDPAALEEELPF